MDATSKRIADAALAALQEADEITGPDRAGYIELMEYLAQECRRRAEVAEANESTRLVLNWFKSEVCVNADIWQTGGGCTAIGIPAGDAHWLITDDSSAPDSMNALVVLGYYWNGGDNWLCFNCQDVYHARSIIDAYACGSV